MRKFYLLIIIIITILIFGLFSFNYFKTNLLPKILEKNYRINTTYNDLRDEILEIRKIHLELGYIKTNLDKKMNFKKISLENLIPYTKDFYGQYGNFERPFGYFDFYKNNIVFVSGKGKIFISNEFRINELDKLIFKEIDTNIEVNYDDDAKIYGEHYFKNLRRNFVRDILILNNEIFIVIFNEISKNKKYYYNTKVIKAKIDLNTSFLEFEDFFTMDESFLSKENGPVDFTHVGGRIISYKNNNLLLSVPDYGHPNSLKAQDPNSFFGKILLLNSNSDAKIFSMGHRNPQGLFYDKDNDMIISSEHGPYGGDEINIVKNNNNYGWPISSYGIGSEDIKYTEHKKHGFEEPAYYFEKNCGPSEIIKIPKDFLSQFKNDYLLGCLSGLNILYGSSFYHYRLIENKLKKVDKIFMNDRIRDLRMFKDNVLVFVLEKQHSIGFIYK